MQQAGNSDYILDAGRAQSNEEAVNLTVVSQMEGFAPKMLGTLRCNRDPRGQHCWSPAALHVPSLSAPNQRRKPATASPVTGELQKLASADTTGQVPSTRVSPGKSKAREAWLLPGVADGKHLELWLLPPASRQARDKEWSFPFGMGAPAVPQATSPRAPFPVLVWLILKSQKCHFTKSRSVCTEIVRKIEQAMLLCPQFDFYSLY